MTADDTASDLAALIEVVQCHHHEYVNGSDAYVRFLTFPLLVRRRGAMRGYSSPEKYVNDANDHRQQVIKSSGLVAARSRVEAAGLLGATVGYVRFHSLRLGHDGEVLSGHAATNMLIRREDGWRITSILVDDEDLEVSRPSST